MKVSFVIVTHDRRELLQRAVESIRKYCPEDIEILVVDNASNDDTREWLEKQDDLISFRTARNVGPGPGRNLGIRAASGDAIFLLDDDAYLTAPVLDVGMKKLYSENDIGCIAFPIWEDSQGRLLYGGRDAQVKCFAAGGALFRKSVFTDTGLFDEQMRWSEEFDLSVRLYAVGYRILGISRPVINHCAATSMTQHNPEKLRAIAYSRLRSFFTHFRWSTALVFAVRVLISISLAGLKSARISPVPLALWDLRVAWPDILKRRNVIPHEIERFYVVADPEEDEFSVPLWQKALKRIAGRGVV